MALPRPREDRWRYLGALLSPTPCSPLLPSRGQSAVKFLVRQASAQEEGRKRETGRNGSATSTLMVE